MTDRPPTPDRQPDDDQALADLDLGAATSDVHPSPAQWAAITSAAGQRRRRRTWVLSAAAAVVVVMLVGTVVVVSDRDSTGSVEVAVGAADSAAGGGPYLLPPEGSTGVAISEAAAGWYMEYTDADGASWLVRADSLSYPTSTVADGVEPQIYRLPPEDVEASVAAAGAPAEVPPFGTVYFSCSGQWSTSSDTAVAAGPGPYPDEYAPSGKTSGGENAPDTATASDPGTASGGGSSSGTGTGVVEPSPPVSLPHTIVPQTTIPGVDPGPDPTTTTTVLPATGFSGPLQAFWLMDGRSVSLVGVPSRGELTPAELGDAAARAQTEECMPPTGPVPELAAAVAALRIVSAEEWRAFLTGDDVEWSTVDPVDPGTTTPPTAPDPGLPTTTVLGPPDAAEDPPADRGTAEEQIARAVAGQGDTDADGNYPNREDGTARAAEYLAMQQLAAKQSGAATVEGGTDTSFTLTSVHFTSPERATISFDSLAKLPTGTYTFAIYGEAMVQDGRWVITYDTFAGMVARACTPPGGYEGCPTDGQTRVVPG